MRKSTVIIIIVFLVGLNLYLATGWLLAEQQIRILEKEVKINQNNQRIISFIQLLTDTVLSGNQEISFDDRLSLEKAVRDLNDPDIFNQWQRFTKSGSDTETQKNFTNLIKALFKKLSY